MMSSNDYFSFDNMSTWLVKECLKVITKIVNISFHISILRSFMKVAIGKLLIKNPSSGCILVNNYISVSTRTFLSEDIERIVDFHLNKYLINNKFNESVQSA